MAFPTTVESTWVNPDSVALDAGELRRADAAVFAGASGIPFGGVVRHGDSSLAVSVDGALNAVVQPGSVVIPGPTVGSGVYRAGLANPASGALNARDATNPRIDLVVFRQLDTDMVGSHAGYAGQVTVITGTPSPTPGVPELPSMAIELARVTVPQSGGGAPAVDSTYRKYACAAGGVLPVPTSARLPASASSRQRAQALDTGQFYEWNGTAWVAASASGVALGDVSVSMAGAAYRTVTVNFPVGRFTNVPSPQVSAEHTTGVFGATIVSVSQTQLVAGVYHRTNANTSLNPRLHWRAEQS